MVKEFTDMGAVVILDLQWNDDDAEQQPTALKGGKGPALDFWDSISKEFKDNELVFYELYNEPHDVNQNDFIKGSSRYAGALEMISTIRANSPDQMLVVAGGGGWAYDSDTLVQLEKETDDNLMMFNFHPYMGPNQAGATEKNADGFENHCKNIVENTDKPIILTEFGQFCCDTDGACYDYNGTWDGHTFGYNEAIINISNKYGASWMPWAFRPITNDSYSDHECEDINADGTGLHLVKPTNGKGADWDRLWKDFANVTPNRSTPEQVREEMLSFLQ